MASLAALCLSLPSTAEAAKAPVELTQQSRDTASELEGIIRARSGSEFRLTREAPSSPQRQKRRPSTAIEAQVLRSELEQRSEEIQTLKEQLRAEAMRPAPSVSAPKPEPMIVRQEEPQKDMLGSAPAASLAVAATSGFSVLNVLGVFAAGAVGGALVLQRKSASQAEASYRAKLKATQGTVDGLRTKVHETQQSLSREQDLAQRLKRESATAASAAQRQVRAVPGGWVPVGLGRSVWERRETVTLPIEIGKESSERLEKEKAALERAIQAEQRRNEAATREAAAVSEALEAEKAARFTADAEAKELQRILSERNATLEREKSLVARLGKESETLKAELEASRKAADQLQERASGLDDALSQRDADLSDLEAARAALESQLRDAHEAAERQEEAYEKLDEDRLSLSEAMTLLRQQTEDMARRAAEEAREAGRRLAETEEDLRAAQSQLGDERSRIQALAAELESTARALAAALADAEARAEAAATDLAGAEAAAGAREAALQSDLGDVSRELLEQKRGREDAAAAAATLQRIVQSAREEMAEARAAAEDARRELRAEAEARAAAEAAAAALHAELAQLAEAEAAARAGASASLEGLRAEYEEAKRGRKKKAAAEVVAEEAGAEGTAGDSKTAPGDDREPGTGAGAAPESDQPPTVIADGSGSGEPGRMEAGSDLEKEAASGEDAVNGGGLASARETTNSSAVESSSTH
ncbi:hypothetical protein F751_0937 [Auxenochlorella protothecoides]|uniref:Uncharacterized protein n=1 Tax=Auxenochlorella protothecoides TaxID=3075 RepID=A0A087SDB9_AUXPR|nr:hypothetical protein F751_0937 [Auxenochlorella protothecoides]KFM23723.1 hypothetical protein F751_0937 [Auxenochlorella protothecoides]